MSRRCTPGSGTLIGAFALACASCTNGTDGTVDLPRATTDAAVTPDVASDIPVDLPMEPDRPTPDAGTDTGTDAGTDTGTDAGTDTGTDTGTDASGTDGAEILGAAFPARLVCGQTAMATVTVRNTGSTRWTRAGGYKLGAVGDSDPLHPGDPRVWLGDGDAVPPGGTYAFVIPLVGPATPGTYTTRWQMVHETVQWFGASTRRDIVVDCPTPADAGGGSPDAGSALPIDLSLATVRNSPPGVAAWPVTARITTLDLHASGVHVDFTRRDGPGSWPDVPFGAPGDSLEYTLWIVLDIGGRWYTSGCIQYWRGLDRNGGPPSGYAMNWYYDPGRWSPMTGHQPAVGERVGFFVTAGNARNVTDGSGSTVMERSDVVVVPFPSDVGATFTF